MVSQKVGKDPRYGLGVNRNNADNAGSNPTLISRSTIESVVAAYPRGHWSGCFANTIGEELKLKPWAHSSAIPNFAETVAENKLMEPWDALGNV